VVAGAVSPIACGPDDGRALAEGTGGVGVVEVAAAANLAPLMDTLVAAFTAGTGWRVRVSFGATGQLFAQIRNGAPYHVLLAADQERPRLLEEASLGVAGTRFTYGEGRLVLYAPGAAPLAARPWALLRQRGIRVAVANPRTAPYGVAALATLERLRQMGELPPLDDADPPAFTLVTGESVGQAFRFVRSGAAEVGLIALSQVVAEPADHYALVPRDLHPPIAQDALLLAPAASHAGAPAFLDFLRGHEARAILARFGYPRGDVVEGDQGGEHRDDAGRGAR
jgi:molybdate transport system substrate-binding protein